MTGLRTKIHLAALFLLPLIVAAFGITTAGADDQLWPLIQYGSFSSEKS